MINFNRNVVCLEPDVGQKFMANIFPNELMAVCRSLLFGSIVPTMGKYGMHCELMQWLWLSLTRYLSSPFASLCNKFVEGKLPVTKSTAPRRTEISYCRQPSTIRPPQHPRNVKWKSSILAIRFQNQNQIRIKSENLFNLLAKITWHLSYRLRHISNAVISMCHHAIRCYRFWNHQRMKCDVLFEIDLILASVSMLLSLLSLNAIWDGVCVFVCGQRCAR